MWTKFFNIGDPISEPASWSRTNLDDMIGVTMEHADCRIEIYGHGQYWQSDTYVNNLESGISGSRLIKRRISKYLDNISVGQILQKTDHLLVINFDVKIIEGSHPPGLYLFNEIPTWFVVEIDVLTNKVSYYLSQERI